MSEDFAWTDSYNTLEPREGSELSVVYKSVTLDEIQQA